MWNNFALFIYTTFQSPHHSCATGNNPSAGRSGFVDYIRRPFWNLKIFFFHLMFLYAFCLYRLKCSPTRMQGEKRSFYTLIFNLFKKAFCPMETGSRSRNCSIFFGIDGLIILLIKIFCFSLYVRRQRDFSIFR